MEKTVKPLFSIGLTLLLIVGVSIASDLEQNPGGGEDPAATPEEGITKSIVSGAQSNPGFVLVITFDAGYLPNSKNIVNALGSLGYTVTDLYNRAAGVIASTLASQTFQQVWLFDIDTSLKLTTADAAALAAWYNANARGNIIIDARSYGAYYTLSTDMPWIANEADALQVRCGGLWIGTDHHAMWTYNGNKLLTAIGYATVTGIHNPPSVAGDTTSELLTTPNLINPATLHAFASPGIAPTGTQFDGTILKKVLWNSSTGQVLVSYSLASNFCEIKVMIDIKPGSCPNPLNVKDKGVLPVAILGTEDFDVTTVDPASILLLMGVEPLRWSYEDVATPFEGELCDCHTLGPDGYLDLTLKFDTQYVVLALEILGGVEDGEEIALPLEGKLLEEHGGTPIEGADCVKIIRKGKK